MGRTNDISYTVVNDGVVVALLSEYSGGAQVKWELSACQSVQEGEFVTRDEIEATDDVHGDTEHEGVTCDITKAPTCGDVQIVPTPSERKAAESATTGMRV